MSSNPVDERMLWVAGDVRLASCDAASGGSIVNQVRRAYNRLGQLITECQSHSGAVNVNSTPKVQYAYTEMSGSANHSRLSSMTYSDGYIVNYNCSSGLNDTISRLSSLSDASGTLAPRPGVRVGTSTRWGISIR